MRDFRFQDLFFGLGGVYWVGTKTFRSLVQEGFRVAVAWRGKTIKGLGAEPQGFHVMSCEMNEPLK